MASGAPPWWLSAYDATVHFFMPGNTPWYAKQSRASVVPVPRANAGNTVRAAGPAGGGAGPGCSEWSAQPQPSSLHLASHASRARSAV